MRKLSRAASSLLAIVAVMAPVYPCTQSPTSQNVINQARVAYYSLARKGFKGFTAIVEPNWEVILAQTATPASLKIFRAVRFTAVVDENGAVTVSHEVGANGPSADVVNKIHFDVQRLVTGFFNTWRMFVVNLPFPETEKQVKIENASKQYRASYATQAGDVTITMTGNFSIQEWNLNSPRMKQTVKPQFQQTAEGFLLTDYTHMFEPVGDGIKTTLDFHIQYQALNGLKVPQKVRVSGMHGSEPVEAELTFILKP